MSSCSSSSESHKTSLCKEGSQISVAVKPKPVEEDKIVSGFQAFFLFAYYVICGHRFEWLEIDYSSPPCMMAL